jgi:ABC-type Zn uptake system ZnuABC Zn-binding protein ZnuA
MKKNKKWLQGIDLNKGALRDYMMQHYGPEAFTKRGTIKVKYINDVIKNGSPHAKRMARLAKTFKKMRK